MNGAEPTAWRSRANSFGPAAELYDRIRPGYPRNALDWALIPLGPGRWRVADIGAGTGIMTRLIASAGHDTIAVEPDRQMRQRLIDTTPDVTVLAGSAESSPLGDRSVDGAVAAQAYHWFDPTPTHEELRRVIRPGGVFAAIWNDRDQAQPWNREYSRLVDGDRGVDGSGADSGRATPSFGEGFGPVEVGRFQHAVTHTAESLVMLLRSRSYYLTAPEDRRVALEAEVRHLVRTHPDLAGRNDFELGYVTLVFRAVRM